MKRAILGTFQFERIGKMVAQYAQAFGISSFVYESECSTREAKNCGYHLRIQKINFLHVLILYPYIYV